MTCQPQPFCDSVILTPFLRLLRGFGPFAAALAGLARASRRRLQPSHACTRLPARWSCPPLARARCWL